MGSRMKIVNNFMAIAMNAVTAETLTLAEASGLERDVVLDVLRGTTARPSWEYSRVPRSR